MGSTLSSFPQKLEAKFWKNHLYHPVSPTGSRWKQIFDSLFKTYEKLEELEKNFTDYTWKKL